MPRRKKSGRKSRRVVFRASVSAVAVGVSQSVPGVRLLPGSDYDSAITIEGILDHPVVRDVRTIIVSVFEDRSGRHDAGRSIGFGKNTWSIVTHMPREQFADLLAVAMADKLDHFHLAFESLNRGYGELNSASFWTRQIPSYVEDDAE
jgi:hypothetical protein